ncbi:MAG TPA: TIGR00730 family Rossman fold protein [Pirellulales bacterium]|jgi:hypothetical protein|nr:TIGR00730 family Rossman fold protein [Pirellulales bacterium]
MTEAEDNLRAILNSSSYVLAERDTALLARRELRPVRLQLELLKPELLLHEHNIESTIVIFGSTRIGERGELEKRLQTAKAAMVANPSDPRTAREVARAERMLAKAPCYEAAREFARIVATHGQNDVRRYVVVTGGGPGIMEAANRGAFDAGAESVGLNITLATEQVPNPYITADLCFQFHYFALRKFHFLLRAQALVVFPGGFGTLDEFFDAITLRQTRSMQEIPIVMFGREYWEQVIDFQFLADEGVIEDAHLDLVSFAETPEEVWNIIANFHRHEP